MTYMLRSAGAALAAATMLVLTSCKDEEPMILELYGDPASTRLEVGVATCNQNPRVEVEESGDEVRLTVVADEVLGDGIDDCGDGAVATLEEPLGERQAIDAATGGPVEVAPFEVETPVG